MVPILTRMIESDDGISPSGSPVWLCALYGLTKVGPKAEPVADVVIRRLKRDKTAALEHGGWVVYNLARISQSDAVLEAVAEDLQNENLSEFNLERGISALKSFGPRATRYVPLLQKIAEVPRPDPLSRVKHYALNAIKTIQGADGPSDPTP